MDQLGIRLVKVTSIMNQGMFEVGKNFGQSILMKIDANIPAIKLEKLYGRIEQKRVGIGQGRRTTKFKFLLAYWKMMEVRRICGLPLIISNQNWRRQNWTISRKWIRCSSRNFHVWACLPHSNPENITALWRERDHSKE